MPNMWTQKGRSETIEKMPNVGAKEGRTDSIVEKCHTVIKVLKIFSKKERQRGRNKSGIGKRRSAIASYSNCCSSSI